MLKGLRQLNISLAAKCQLLFGTAVALIIGAALFVPWQRIEQLTDQLNDRSAAAVASALVNDHVVRQTALGSGNLLSTATESPPTTQSAAPEFPVPKLIGLRALQSPERLNRFELTALTHFARDRHRVEKRYYDNNEGFRYAEALYATERCINCHNNGESASTTAPTAQSAALLGMVSVDLPSQVKSKEVLLNRIFLLVAGLIAGSLAIIIFYLITTRLILQPVRVLQETAERVAEGDLNIRSDINTGDEFQQLSETFNTMLINLKKGSDQLRAVNKSLDLKLGQLAESNVALYESNRLKSEFLANVSHELRTPLNSILGFAELLKDLIQQGPDSKTTRYLQNILSSGTHLLDLINDLLDLAKIEAGRMEVRSEPLSLPDLFEGLVSLLKPLTEAKKLTITASIATDVPILQSDPAKLQQVLYNFLSNAIKFSPGGEKILLSAELANGEGVRLSVTDSGPGISRDKHELIFEKFRQLDASHTRQHSGTGLGLAISKELATLLGGKVGVRSAAGEGATFWITIPLAIESGAQELRSKLVLT